MVLDEATFNKVRSLFKIQWVHISYCGCWDSNTVTFSLFNREQPDGTGYTTCGITVTITHEFSIKRVERISSYHYNETARRYERHQLPIIA